MNIVEILESYRFNPTGMKKVILRANENSDDAHLACNTGFGWGSLYLKKSRDEIDWEQIKQEILQVNPDVIFDEQQLTSRSLGCCGRSYTYKSVQATA